MLKITIMQLMQRTMTCRYREQVFRQIATIVNTTVRHNEPLNRWLVFDTRVVKTCVQHDDRERQHIARVYTTSTQALSERPSTKF